MRDAMTWVVVFLIIVSTVVWLAVVAGHAIGCWMSGGIVTFESNDCWHQEWPW